MDELKEMASVPDIKLPESESQLETLKNEQHDAQVTTGVVLAIVGTFFFAMKSIWIKSSYSVGGDPTLMLTLRMLLSAPFYIGMLAYLRKYQPGKKLAMRKVAMATLLGFFGYYLASYLDLRGLELISAQLERLTLFTYPAMIAILAWAFLGERITSRILMSLVLCYLGVLVMYSRESQFGDVTNTAIGVLLVLGSALSYSVYIVIAKPLIAELGSREFTSFAMLGSSVFIGAHFCLLSEHELSSVPIQLWGYGILLAFVCTVIPSFMINAAIGRIGATRTTIIGSVGPVITMILAIVLLKEPTSISHFLGMVIVIVGVSLISKS